MLSKIISGGQTGADRAALDAGLDRGFPTGGSCPVGRMAEDGPLDSRYKLDEISGGYRARTRKNVEDSDGTVVFYENILEGGTEQTVAFCIKAARPYKLIDIDLVNHAVAATKILSFISASNVKTLNVAGPRHSKCPVIYNYVKNTIHLVLDNLSK